MIVDDQVEVFLSRLIIPTQKAIATRHAAAKKPIAPIAKAS